MNPEDIEKPELTLRASLDLDPYSFPSDLNDLELEGVVLEAVDYIVNAFEAGRCQNVTNRGFTFLGFAYEVEANYDGLVTMLKKRGKVKIDEEGYELSPKWLDEVSKPKPKPEIYKSWGDM